MSINDDDPDFGVHGNVSIDTTRSYRGSNSLHVHMDRVPGSSYPSASVSESGEVPQTGYFVRAFVYLPQNSLTANIEFVMGQNPLYYLWGIFADNLGHLGYSDDIPPTRGYQSPSTLMPSDRWVCLEWQVIAAGNNDLGGGNRLYLDDVEQTDLTQTTGYPADRFPSSVVLGLFPDESNTVTPLDVWFDEVAVDSQRIGCDK